jgi:hypothetical protein
MTWPSSAGYSLWLSGTAWTAPAITSPSTTQVDAAVGSSTNLTLSGGQDFSGNSAGGALTTRGANQTGAGGSSSAAGGILVAGGNNAATNASSTAGSVEVLSGASTGSSTPGLNGLLLISRVYNFTGSYTQWGLVCMTSTSDTVTNCAASPLAGVVTGVAVAQPSSTTVEVALGDSQVPINSSASATVGNSVTALSTAGKVTPGTTLQGVYIGQAIAISGAYPGYPDGTAFPTLSATLPLVQLNIQSGICLPVNNGAYLLAYNSLTTCFVLSGFKFSSSTNYLLNATDVYSGLYANTAGTGNIGSTTGWFNNIFFGQGATYYTEMQGASSQSGNATLISPLLTGSDTLTTNAATETLTNKTVNGVVLTAAGSATTFLNGAGSYTAPSGTYWGPSFAYSGIPGANQLIGIYTPPADRTITVNASCTNFKAYEVTAGSGTDTYTLNLYPTNAFSGSPTAEATITFSSSSTVGAFSSCNGSTWNISAGTGITITNSGTAATGATVVVTLEGVHN